MVKCRNEDWKTRVRREALVYWTEHGELEKGINNNIEAKLMEQLGTLGEHII